MECKATFSYLLMYFVPQFTEATDIITLESVTFPMRFCVHVYIKKFIASSSNNIFYIQIHRYTQQTMLNQTLYHTMQYPEPNTKSMGGGNHPLFGSRRYNK